MINWGLSEEVPFWLLFKKFKSPETAKERIKLARHGNRPRKSGGGDVCG